MTKAKQIAYFYDAILAEKETEMDVDGSLTVPAKGDIRKHGEKAWCVEHVEMDRTAPSAIPIYCVYLKEVEN